MLSKDPYKAVKLIPDRLKFKQLLELCQLCAGIGITKQMKPIRQGIKIQEWITKNKEFIFVYFNELFSWVKCNIGISVKTWEKLAEIQKDLYFSCKKITWDYPTIAIFRYVKEYSEFTEYESNSELPIDIAIIEYKRYLEYKEKQFNKKKLIKKKDVKNDTKRN